MRTFVAPLLLAMSLLVLSGCGNTPDPLPKSDTAPVDDMMDDMVVPPVDQ